MDRHSANNQALSVGTGLTAVFWTADRARAERAYVYAEAPFYVSTSFGGTRMQSAEPGLLLWTRGDEVLVSDIRTTDIATVEDRTVVGMDLQGWRRVDDRRRSPRIAHTGSVAVLPYQFSDEINVLDPVHGRIIDLSMSGALIVLPHGMEIGQVVEFRTRLGDEVAISVLGVVARHDQATDGYGVAFLEFMGSGEGDLRRYLATVA